MNTKRVILLVALWSVSFWGCNGGQTVGPRQTVDARLPLAAANKWQYLRTFVDSSGTVSGYYNIVDSAYGPITVDTLTGYSISNFLYFQFWGSVFANEPDGLYEVVNPATLPSPTPPAQPSPPVVHKVLNSPTFAGDECKFENWDIRTESVDDTVAVPAGTFHCIAYDVLVGDSVASQVWLSPTVGIVKMWQYIGNTRQVNQLTRYEVH